MREIAINCTWNAPMQNRLRLGLQPRTCWGAYDTPPDPLVGWGETPLPIPLPSTPFDLCSWTFVGTGRKNGNVPAPLIQHKSTWCHTMYRVGPKLCTPNMSHALSVSRITQRTFHIRLVADFGYGHFFTNLAKHGSGEISSWICQMPVTPQQYIQFITDQTNTADLSSDVIASVISVTRTKKYKIHFHLTNSIKTDKQWCNKRSTTASL